MKGLDFLEHLTETPVSTELKYNGIIARVRLDDARLPNGKLAKREVVEHPGAVVILPLLPDGRVYCVRQYRYAFSQVLLELPAGKLEYGEEPSTAALRELKEEVGAVPARLDYLGKLYPSPGYTNEVHHLYLARDLTMGNACPDEDEFLQVELIPLAELADMVLSGNLPDATSATAILMAERFLAQEDN